MSSTTKDKRIRRIERRGSPELIDAMHKGIVSARLADDLLHLPEPEQRAELQRRLDARARRERRSNVAAQVIRSYLSSAPRVDLAELRRSIETALSASRAREEASISSTNYA